MQVPKEDDTCALGKAWTTTTTKGNDDDDAGRNKFRDVQAPE